MATPTSRDKRRFRIARADLLWAVVAPFFALALRDPGLLDPADPPNVLTPPFQYALVSIGCALVAFAAFGLADRIGQFFSVRDALVICAASACAVGASSVTIFTVTRLDGVPRSTPLIFGLVLGVGLIAVRIATQALHGEMWRRGVAAKGGAGASRARKVIVIGVDRFVAAAIKLTDYQQPRTTRVVAALDARPEFGGRKINGASIVGAPRDIGAVVDEYAVHGVAIDQIWLSEDEAALPAECLADVRAQCEARGLSLMRISQALNLAPPAATSVAESEPEFETSGYFALKRSIDLCLATLLSIALLPLAAGVACVILWDVGAPILFWQQREGRGGRKFLLYKFRTYRAPFDAAGRVALEHERLSPIGRAIRAARLDEIPQLYNVIAGHMSLIGPRPLLPCDQPRDPRRRLSVRPGVTGWAQINGGRGVTPEEKNALDVWYIRHASLRLDFNIAIGTLLVALTGEKMNGATVDHAFRWYSDECRAAESGARQRERPEAAAISS